MSTSAYNSRSIDCKEPFGAVAVGVTVKFHISLCRSDAVKHARLMIEKDAGEPVSVKMQWESINESNDIFACEYTSAEAGLYFYWFEAETPAGLKYICLEAHGKGNLSLEKGDLFQQTVYDASYKTPQWLKGGVMYQIFPDRFCKKGEPPKEQPQGRVLLDEWGELPSQSVEGGYCSNYYFGGNIEGIISKLPYLQSLGVTTIYMNPIFESHAYHRYNTADYMKIDSLLGDDEDFKNLCTKAEELGIKIILDGVFSHTGADSIYFNMFDRYPQLGAYQSKESKYYSWYDFEEWPDEYRCWWGFKELPEVNEKEPDFFDFITGKDGVAQHWLNLGASGWRLDVTDELPDELIDKLRKSVKQANPESILIGEVWEDASNKISYGERRRYLEGSQLDSVMNYPWRSAVINYIKTGEASELADSVLTILENYPKETVDVLMNLLGSHDTIRLITCFAGENQIGKSLEWKQYTRMTPERRTTGLTLVRLASTIQYTLPGVPCVYYGDEAGFEGYEDPFNRQCYIWGEEDKSLIDWFSKLGALRAACPVLKTGEYRQIVAEHSLFAFERKEGSDTITVVVNAGLSAVSIPVQGRLCLSFDGTSISDGVLSLPSFSCAILGSGDWVKNIETYIS